MSEGWRKFYPHLDTTASQEKKRSKPPEWEKGPRFKYKDEWIAMIIDEHGKYIAHADDHSAEDIIRAHNAAVREMVR